MFNYHRSLTDEEMAILENDLLDVKDWIDKAIEGKINNCRKRILKAILVGELDLTVLAKIDPNPVKAFLKSKKENANGKASPSV